MLVPTDTVLAALRRTRRCGAFSTSVYSLAKSVLSSLLTPSGQKVRAFYDSICRSSTADCTRKLQTLLSNKLEELPYNEQLYIKYNLTSFKFGLQCVDSGSNSESDLSM